MCFSPFNAVHKNHAQFSFSAFPEQGNCSGKKGHLNKYADSLHLRPRRPCSILITDKKEGFLLITVKAFSIFVSLKSKLSPISQFLSMPLIVTDNIPVFPFGGINLKTISAGCR